MSSSSESPRVKVRINPITGKAETVADTANGEDAKAKLEQTRRELREVLHGTGQIEVPEAVPAPAPAKKERTFNPARCTCGHPPHRAPCSYCEGDVTDEDWEDFCDDI